MSKIAFAPTITYIGKGKPNPELVKIIAGLCHEEWQVSPRSLRKAKGESLEDAAFHYVRRQIEQAAEQSGYQLDTAPFTIDVGLIVEDVTDDEAARGAGFGITLGRRLKS